MKGHAYFLSCGLSTICTYPSSWSSIPALGQFAFSSIPHFSTPLLDATGADMKATSPHGPLPAGFHLASANGKY